MGKLVQIGRDGNDDIIILAFTKGLSFSFGAADHLEVNPINGDGFSQGVFKGKKLIHGIAA